MRPIIILEGLTLVLALPVAAQTFGLVAGSAPQACLTIGTKTYRLAGRNADMTVRVDPAAAAPGLRITLADTPGDADFVLVDDGIAPNCRTGAIVKEVGIADGTAADLIVALVNEGAPADYRIYVRSRWIAPETAAALFAAARVPPRRMTDSAFDRSN